MSALSERQKQGLRQFYNNTVALGQAAETVSGPAETMEQAAITNGD